MIVLLAAGAFVFLRARAVSISQHQLITPLKLGRCDSSFVCPKGHHFNFIIGVPKNNQFTTLRGTLSLQSGTNHFELRFEDEMLLSCNWLEREGLQGYIIRSPQKESWMILERFLKINSSVVVNVKVDKLDQNETSLWLAYLARWSWHD